MLEDIHLRLGRPRTRVERSEAVDSIRSLVSSLNGSPILLVRGQLQQGPNRSPIPKSKTIVRI